MPRLSRFVITTIASAVVTIILTYGSYALGLWAGGHRSIRDYLLKSLVLLPVLIGLLAAWMAVTETETKPAGGGRDRSDLWAYLLLSRNSHNVLACIQELGRIWTFCFPLSNRMGPRH